ncbi:MAG: ferredoxin family protein [Bacillota bacterium]
MTAARGLLQGSGAPAAARPLRFDADRCTGCNRCVEVCQLDVLHPAPEKGKPPLVAYPGECWYCGACVMECPRPGAIRLQHPLMNRVHWRPRLPDAGGERPPQQE